MTEPDELVKLDIENNVAILTLNSPSTRNAVDGPFAQALSRRLSEVTARRDQIKGMVLCAAGDHFMVGGNIRFFNDELAQPHTAPERIGQLVGAFNDAVRLLDKLPFPVVAVVQGAAAGAGLSLAVACDMIIATDDTRFVFAYSALGATPDGGGSWSLARRVGPQVAMHMYVFNEPMDAQRAHQLGLVASVVPRDSLQQTIQDTVDRLAAGSRGSLHNGKALIRGGLTHSLHIALDKEKESFVGLAGQADFAEGVDAFMQKRPPKFEA